MEIIIIIATFINQVVIVDRAVVTVPMGGKVACLGCARDVCLSCADTFYDVLETLFLRALPGEPLLCLPILFSPLVWHRVPQSSVP